MHFPPASCLCVGAGGDKVKVGICHNVWWIEPKSKGLLYMHTRYRPRSAHSLHRLQP